MVNKTSMSKFAIGNLMLSSLLNYVDDCLWSDNLDGTVKDWDDFEDGTRVVVFNCNPGTCMSLDDWVAWWSDFPEWYLPTYILGVNGYPYIANMMPQDILSVWENPEFNEYNMNGTHNVEFGVKRGKYPWF